MKIALPKVLPFTPPAPPGWPAKAGDAAWRGPVGEFASAIEPFTEADPHAILISILAGVGNIFGRNAFWRVGSDIHYANLFAFVIGDTSIGRKGLSWKEAYHLIDTADPTWPKPVSGLSTGEGLINVVRDDSLAKKTIREKGQKPREVPEVVGVVDKRKMILETEFGRPLRAMTRQGNTLMPVLNDAWDSRNLSVMTKNQPLTATDPHISIVGHITLHELRELFSRSNDVPLFNGFANRWLWTLTRSVRDIPSPIDFSTSKESTRARLRIMEGVSWVRSKKREFVRSAQAGTWWDEELYVDLKHNRSPGPARAVTDRPHPMVMRLAMIYAALDRSSQIKRTHLESGLAVWKRCEASANYIFNLYDPGRDSKRTRKLSTALQRAGATGLTRKQIYRDVFERNLDRDSVEHLLRRLHDAGLVSRREERPSAGRGRTIERWRWSDLPSDGNE